jgi:hypothetical protein
MVCLAFERTVVRPQVDTVRDTRNPSLINLKLAGQEI